jgi:hypothetical protein
MLKTKPGNELSSPHPALFFTTEHDSKAFGQHVIAKTALAEDNGDEKNLLQD